MKRLLLTLLLSILLMGSAAQHIPHTTEDPQEPNVVDTTTVKEETRQKAEAAPRYEFETTKESKKESAEPENETPAKEAELQAPTVAEPSKPKTAAQSMTTTADVYTPAITTSEVADYQATVYTEEIPSVTVPPKTGYTMPEEELSIPVSPEPVNEMTADLDAAMREANDYAAATYGITIDSGLTMDNSGYFFPAMAPGDATQDFVAYKATDMVDYTMQKILSMNGVSADDPRLADLRLNAYIYEENGEIHCYCLYG